MVDALDYLPLVPLAVAMLGSLFVLWGCRRRSPKAVGLATAGIVGGLVTLVSGPVVMARGSEHIQRHGHLLGVPAPLAYSLPGTAWNAAFAVCLLVVAWAVVADRRPRGADDGLA